MQNRGRQHFAALQSHVIWRGQKRVMTGTKEKVMVTVCQRNKCKKVLVMLTSGQLLKWSMLFFYLARWSQFFVQICWFVTKTKQEKRESQVSSLSATFCSSSSSDLDVIQILYTRVSLVCCGRYTSLSATLKTSSGTFMPSITASVPCFIEDNL